MGFAKTILATSALVLAAGAASAAHLSAIEVYDDQDIDPTGDLSLQATVSCSGCSVLTYDGTYGFGSPGELFTGPAQSAYGPGNPPAQEAAWLNDVVGGSYTYDGGKVDGASDGTSYFSLAEYIVIKVGGGNTVTPYTIIRNDSGGQLEFSWSGASGAGAGLSHWTPFGVIPIPATGLLLLGGLGALVGLRRRG